MHPRRLHLIQNPHLRLEEKNDGYSSLTSRSLFSFRVFPKVKMEKMIPVFPRFFQKINTGRLVRVQDAHLGERDYHPAPALHHPISSDPTRSNTTQVQIRLPHRSG
jgi:hypothetical protein